MTKATVMVGLLAACAGCAREAPLAPTDTSVPIQSSVTGRWSIQYVPTYCNAHRQTNFCRVSPQRLTLHLRRGGDSVSGVVEVHGIVIDVRGAMDATGEMVMSGRAVSPGITFPTAEVHSLRVRSTGDGLTGSIEFEIDYRTSWASYYGLNVVRGNITAASRAPLPDPATLTGRWSGQYVHTACGPCYYDGVGWEGYVEVDLTQSGESVSGVVSLHGLAVPVAGSVRNGELALSGAVSDSRLGGGVLNITAWRTRIDLFGRLSGTLSYVQTSPDARYEVEFVSLLPSG